MGLEILGESKIPIGQQYNELKVKNKNETGTICTTNTEGFR